MVLGNRETGGLDWDWELFLCLEVGFRHLTPAQPRSSMGYLTHTDSHQEVISMVFARNKKESIADLLCAVTFIRPGESNRAFDLCAKHIIDLRNTVAVPFSPRLRQHVIYFVKRGGYRRFKEVNAEGAVELLNHLYVGIEDIDDRDRWGSIFLEVIQSPEGFRRLATHSWELLMELKVKLSWTERKDIVARHPHITDNILLSQQWDKLECWVGLVWMSSPIPESAMESLKRAMASLFRQRPEAVLKLTEWLERCLIEGRKGVPESFREICKQMHETRRFVPFLHSSRVPHLTRFFLPSR